MTMNERRSSVRLQTESGAADPSAFSTLIDTFRDDEAKARFWSAYALGQIGDARAASTLKELAECDPGCVEGLGTDEKKHARPS